MGERERKLRTADPWVAKRMHPPCRYTNTYTHRHTNTRTHTHTHTHTHSYAYTHACTKASQQAHKYMFTLIYAPFQYYVAHTHTKAQQAYTLSHSLSHAFTSIHSHTHTLFLACCLPERGPVLLPWRRACERTGRKEVQL